MVQAGQAQRVICLFGNQRPLAGDERRCHGAPRPPNGGGDATGQIIPRIIQPGQQP